MTRRSETIALPAPAPGTRRELVVHRWGEPGARPKAYFQAALHADELPGVLMLDHLAQLLDEADARGEIRGEIVLLPYANPIGFDQSVGDNLIGRYRFADGGGNFNRDWPNLTPMAADALAGRIANDPATNVRLVREALLGAVAGLPAATEREAHQKALLSHSVDADLVFDVHCDWRATLHIYASREHEDELAVLGREIGASVMLLDDELGARPFDGANGFPWQELRGAFGIGPELLPPSCFAMTVELRGQADVTDAYAAGDAEAVLRYLMRRGVLAGDPGDLPAPAGRPTPLDATYALTAPAAGIVVWHAALGDTVTAGDTVAELVEFGAGAVPAPRHPVVTRQSGILFSMHHEPLQRPGERIGKVAGSDPIERRPGEQLLSNR